MRALDSLAAPAPISGNDEAVSELSHDNKGDVTSGNDEVEAMCAELTRGEELTSSVWDLQDQRFAAAALIRKLDAERKEWIEAVDIAHANGQDCLQQIHDLKAERATFYMDYRMRHDISMKALQAQVEELCAERAMAEQHNKSFRRANESWVERYAELEDQIAELQKRNECLYCGGCRTHGIDAAIAKEASPADSATAARPGTE